MDDQVRPSLNMHGPLLSRMLEFRAFRDACIHHSTNMSGDKPANPLANVPHYALPNFAQVLPEYVNAEADLIRQAFQAGNFRHLQSLPDQIKPHSVLETRLDHMEQNRNFSISGDYQRVLNAQGLFSSFQHEHSEYGVEKLIAKRERAEHLAILEKFGRPAMLTGSNLFKMKYEEQFPGKDRPPHEPAFKYIADDSEAAAEKAAEERWAERAKILAGPFVPSGPHKLYDPATKSLLPNILFELQRLLLTDWPDMSPHIYSDENDLIICEFVDPNPAVLPAKPRRRGSALDIHNVPTDEQASSPAATSQTFQHSSSAVSLLSDDMMSQFESAAAAAEREAAAVLRGVAAYMNTLLLSSEFLSRFSLVRVVEVWNHRVNGCIYFTFRPPWVHTRPVETFYTLHPEERKASTLLGVRRKEADDERLLRIETKKAHELGPEFAAMHVASQMKQTLKLQSP